MPARVRCKDSASEHLTPPFILSGAQCPAGKTAKAGSPEIVSSRLALDVTRMGLGAFARTPHSGCRRKKGPTCPQTMPDPS